MKQNNNKNGPDADATGDVMSWVIIFILLFAFPPVGLLLLILKMRDNAKPTAEEARRVRSQGAESAHRVPHETGDAANEAQASTQDAGDDAERVVRDAGTTAEQIMRDAGTLAGQAVREVEAAARQATSAYSGVAKQTVSEIFNDFTNAFSQPAKTQQQQQQQQQQQHQHQQQQQQQPQYQYQQQHQHQQRKPKKKRKDKSPLEKKSGKFISVFLLLISIAMLVLGVSGFANAAQTFFSEGQHDWFNIVMSSFYTSGAFVTFFSRNIFTRRFGRYKNYFAIVAGRDIVPLTDIAYAAGVSYRAVRRDIQAMINAGYLDRGSYIDYELDSLVLCPTAGDTARKSARAAHDSSVHAPQGERTENAYMDIVLEFRELRASIADISISTKVSRIEDLTAKIFRIVEEDPEKQPKIRRFMSYYLPTTQKLIRSYATLEKQGVKGENITAAKENIGRILDTLATGFEQQLDQLFSTDAMDIAADITVLENLMHQDGLAGDKMEFKVMEG